MRLRRRDTAKAAPPSARSASAPPPSSSVLSSGLLERAAAGAGAGVLGFAVMSTIGAGRRDTAGAAAGAGAAGGAAFGGAATFVAETCAERVALLTVTLLAVTFLGAALAAATALLGAARAVLGFAVTAEVELSVEVATPLSEFVGAGDVSKATGGAAEMSGTGCACWARAGVERSARAAAIAGRALVCAYCVAFTIMPINCGAAATVPKLSLAWAKLPTKCKECKHLE